jgi:phage tail sheath protein FI
MPITEYRTPGVYIEEIPAGPRPIAPVGTSTAAFVGRAPNADAFKHEVRAINNWSQFTREFVREGDKSTDLSHAVFGFFLNGGRRCFVVNIGTDDSIAGGGRTRKGLDLLDEVDEAAIIVAPGYCDAASYDAVLSHCEKLKDRFAIMDSKAGGTDIGRLTQTATASTTKKKTTGGGDSGDDDSGGGGGGPSGAGGLRPRESDGGYGAFYFPRIVVRDPLSDDCALVEVPPSGHIAGIYARTDATRGVHKAPANEVIRGALNVEYRLTREEQGELNDAGVNGIRFFPQGGIRVWGGRTVAPASSPWRYINVRRLFAMAEEAIGRDTRWIVFEPNDEPLWKAIRRDISAFLKLLWRDGALMGRTPEQAFFVQCDEETNPPEVIDAGMVVAVIGMAPVKPAEFIVFRIGQHAGGVEIESE